MLMVHIGNCEYATVGSKCLSVSGLLVLEPWVSKGKEGDPGRTEISIVHAFKMQILNACLFEIHKN